MQNNIFQPQKFSQNQFPQQGNNINNQQVPNTQNYFNQQPQIQNQQQNKQPMNFPPQTNILQQQTQQLTQINQSTRIISVSQRNISANNETHSVRNILPQNPVERNQPSIRNNPPQILNNQPNQIFRDAPKSVRNQNNTPPPQAPLSVKTNKSWSAQKPAFVEYLPPVYIPHIEPMITQTLVDNPIQVVDLNRFQEMWNKRMQGIEDLLKIQPEQVVESLELRASGQDDSQQVTELQNELYQMKLLMESRDREIFELKSQLQSTIEQLDFENEHSKNEQKILISELEFKISTLQQTINSLQMNLRSSNETIEQYRIEILSLKTESQSYQQLCIQKDVIIQQLNFQLEELTQKINILNQEIITTTSYRSFEEEAILWKTKYQQLNDTYHACQEKLMVKEAEYELLFKSQSQYQLQISQFQLQISQRDQEIEDLRQQIEELYQQVDQLNEEITTTSSVRTYEEEANMWKRKFKELNDTYHACQEKLMVKEAEYESLLKSQSSQQKIVTQTTVYKQGTSTRSVRNESEISSSMTSNDIEKFQAQQKTVMM